MFVPVTSSSRCLCLCSLFSSQCLVYGELAIADEKIRQAINAALNTFPSVHNYYFRCFKFLVYWRLRCCKLEFNKFIYSFNLHSPNLYWNNYTPSLARIRPYIILFSLLMKAKIKLMISSSKNYIFFIQMWYYSHKVFVKVTFWSKFQKSMLQGKEVTMLNVLYCCIMLCIVGGTLQL